MDDDANGDVDVEESDEVSPLAQPCPSSSRTVSESCLDRLFPVESCSQYWLVLWEAISIWEGDFQQNNPAGASLSECKF